MSLLVGGSILATFFAGSVALFSPCCIVFLMPAYLAAGVKGRRWALFPLTLVFAAGLALVILPITLGVGLLASTLARYHTPFYLAGGLLMIALGGLALAGRSWSLPMGARAPAIDRTDAPGVLALGVFSGIASSCCAPVLAGVVTLSALAGSLVGSLALGLAYVFGMVFPLFLIALIWDRFRLGERRALVGREVSLRIGGSVIHTTSVNVAVGAIFLLMGLGVVVLGLTGNTTASPGFLLTVGRLLSGAFGRVVRWTDGVPDPVLGLLLLLVAALVVFAGIRGARSGSKEPCHGTEEQEEARQAVGETEP